MRATKLIAVLAFVLAASASVISPAKAQGTDCRYPASPPLTIAELTVCRNPELFELEQRLTRRYLRIRDELRGGELYQFEQQQEAWRARRRQCGYDTRCLHSVYGRRLDELRAYREDLRDDRPDPRNYPPQPRPYRDRR